jgi:uncharacterized protein (DUF433 family)
MIIFEDAMHVNTLPVHATPDEGCIRAMLSLREVVTLAEIPEKRVRKDIETGVLETPNVWRLNDARLCFPWDSVFPLAAVYSNAFLTGRMRKIALDRVKATSLNIHCMSEDLHPWVFASDHFSAMPAYPLVVLDRYVTLDMPAVCEKLLPKVSLYMRGLKRVEEKKDILGGAAVFKDTRLSVVHVGRMVENGETVANILEDYPYLTDADVSFATIYCRAHPLVGRPSTNEDLGADAKTRVG